MPDNLPIHAETLRGYVMHDLGEMAARRKSPPQLVDARRFVAARGEEFGVPSSQWEVVAKAAIRDWRASHRVQERSPDLPISSGYISGPPIADVIGVRVVLTITYPGATPPGAKTRASVLLNAQPSESIQDVIDRALNAWNMHNIETTHGFRSGGKATHGEIVQVVLGGFSQAQI